MAGLLAWAADVVGGGGGQDNEQDIPLIFTQDQQRYVLDLDHKASSLGRSIHDLRLRLPPSDISQRLPDLHAHSLASNAALALQLNSHSTTREQAQLREVTLQEENAAYERAISNCESKIQEKIQEADLLKRKLMEMDESEGNLRDELENAETALDASRSGQSDESTGDPNTTVETENDVEASKKAILEKFEERKKELSSMEAVVNDLEERWAESQENALSQPSPVQREKILDKQLHSVIEQLEAKQAQAEGLVNEIHLKEMELERLNALWRNLESSNIEMNTARNRFGRSASGNGSASSDYILDGHHRNADGRAENQQRLMLLRSGFVLYILALNILVFIKISF
ncbi:chromosome partition protein Smc-like [Pyrus x bretschneideri]|uniref:chromosome partition protein Smc-like n=1 Tax=Pyrus x bretschneideri TaxID=225117 RepID=UPI00202E9918|nr:chromosome partition protein Smc-like [Pyrus x bretschneideri]